VSEEFGVGELEPIIEEAWEGVRADYRKMIWYAEAEIVTSFYHNLRSNEKFRNICEKYRLIPILEYSPHKRFDAKIVRGPYPQPKHPKKQFEKYTSFDFVIIEFLEDPHNYKEHFDNWRFTYWSIEHIPLIAMEFKYPSCDEEEDLRKLERLIEAYGAKLCYFCFIAEEKPDLPKVVNEEKFRIAYGLCDNSEWGIATLARYRTILEHEK